MMDGYALVEVLADRLSAAKAHPEKVERPLRVQAMFWCQILSRTTRLWIKRPSSPTRERVMALDNRLLLIVLDGVPWRNWRRLMGNLEGWVQSGEARVWKMRSVLPSTSACCYASIHTGVPPQLHGILSNENRFRVEARPLLGSRQGRRQDGCGHAFLLVGVLRPLPFDLLGDLEYDEPGGPIHHGRFHTMTGYNGVNQMTPSDVDLFATLTMLTKRFDIDYGILHTCTLDSMGHRFGHDCIEMDKARLCDGRHAGRLPAALARGRL